MAGTTSIKRLVETARSTCGCLSCCGRREVGAHTIAGGEPRVTPMSCLATVLLTELIRAMNAGELKGDWS